MTFTQLAVVGLLGLLGPVLAYPRGWHLPVVLGELVAGIAVGRTGLGYLDAASTTFTLLADIGFALVMFVAGTHVPVRDPALRSSLRGGLARAAVVGLLAVLGGWAIAAVSGVPHAALYAVLLASSSAALVLPAVDSLRLAGPPVLALLPQIAVADAVCIVALPLAIDPGHAVRAAGGALAVIAAAGVLFVALLVLERRGVRDRVHDVSESRLFATELRLQLVLLFTLAALAVTTHVSIMLAGFALGLAVTAVGEPRRLANQLFALTEGFFGPLFFVWLGAGLDLRAFGARPGMIGLGVALGLVAALTHVVGGRVLGQPPALGLLACAQLGLPVAAATVGTQLGVLRPGESSALVLGAVISIGCAVLGGALAVRAGMTGPAPGSALPAVGGGR